MKSSLTKDQTLINLASLIVALQANQVSISEIRSQSCNVTIAYF